jgi:hypothetical protein
MGERAADSKAVNLRGHFEAQMALDDADWSSSPLAFASILAGQGLYQEQ